MQSDHRYLKLDDGVFRTMVLRFVTQNTADCACVTFLPSCPLLYLEEIGASYLHHPLSEFFGRASITSELQSTILLRCPLPVIHR